MKKIIVSLLGFSIMAFGVAFSIKAELGTSPISSVPYVTGEISGLSVGTTTIIMHCVFILLQMILLRREYQLFQLSQLIVALIFGGMTDLAVFCIRSVTVGSYVGQWGLCIIGIILVGIGVTLVLIAAVLSFVFLEKITGVREGTLAAALLVGQISKLCLKHYRKLGKWINA
jgi:uncharacterized membrane protein YczE